MGRNERLKFKGSEKYNTMSQIARYLKDIILINKTSES